MHRRGKQIGRASIDEEEVGRRWQKGGDSLCLDGREQGEAEVKGEVDVTLIAFNQTEYI